MITYSEFRPMACDHKGVGLEDRQHWLVAPVSRNRDSSVLQESNWNVVTDALNKLDRWEEADDEPEVEIHRFSHWACGWVEVCLIRPDTPAAAEAERFESALADYPIASDEAFSMAEHEAAYEVWRSMRPKERLKAIEERPQDWKFERFSELLGTVRAHGDNDPFFHTYNGELSKLYGE
jgi:hypothetical protein